MNSNPRPPSSHTTIGSSEAFQQDGAHLPRGDVVFAVARGVATVVTIAAFTVVMVMLIIFQAILMLVAEKIGLVSVILIVLTVMFALAYRMGVPFQSLARILVFLWAF